MALHCTNLSCQRNGRVIFENLNLIAKPGELVELRGHNGSGKSSLLRMIAGLVPSSSGEIKWLDQLDVAQNCHYIGHLDGLKAAQTVSENLQFWATLLGGENISAALKMFALEALSDQPVQILSAGQKRRTALAKLLCAKRELWLLDEPATALDQTSRQHLRFAMQTHLNEGGIIIMATHDDEAMKAHHTITLGAAV